MERRVWAERKVHFTSSRSLRRSGKVLPEPTGSRLSGNQFLRRANLNRGKDYLVEAGGNRANAITPGDTRVLKRPDASLRVCLDDFARSFSQQRNERA